jgi:hypothetical protein
LSVINKAALDPVGTEDLGISTITEDDVDLHVSSLHVSRGKGITWTGLIAFHWKSFYKYFMNKSHEAHLTISCFFFLCNTRALYICRQGCEKVLKKEWGSLKVSARLAY